MEILNRPGIFTHNDVKEILEQLISVLVENSRHVELADDFFVKANIRITKKNRNRPKKRLLISEKDTSQENITDEMTKFWFKTSFEETTSISLATSQGFCANVGGGLSGGAVGASLGLSSGLEYSKSKSFGQDKSRAQNKELTAEVHVKKHTRVIVKELTYKVEWAAVCELELMLRKEDKIEYKCTGRWGKEQSNYIEVKKLLKKLSVRKKKLASSLAPYISLPQRLVVLPSPDHIVSPSTDFPSSTEGYMIDPSPDSDVDFYYNRVSPVDHESTVQVRRPRDGAWRLWRDPPQRPGWYEAIHGVANYQGVSSTSAQVDYRVSNSPSPVDYGVSPPSQKSETSSVEHGPTPKTKSVQFQNIPEVVTMDRDPSPDNISNSSFFSAVEHIEETESSPTPSSPKSNTSFTGETSDPSQAKADSRVLLTEHMLVIEFTSDCLFSAEEHKLEIIELPSNPKRVKRIIDHQTGIASQNDKDDMLLSLKNDKYTST